MAQLGRIELLQVVPFLEREEPSGQGSGLQAALPTLQIHSHGPGGPADQRPITTVGEADPTPTGHQEGSLPRRTVEPDRQLTPAGSRAHQSSPWGES